MNIDRFRNACAGETVVLVGNGANLAATPPQCFDYPTIGMNTIHLYPGEWKPTYYVTVDRRVWREFGDAILARFADIPKFVPTPKLLRWRGPNFYRFPQRPGRLYSSKWDRSIWQEDISQVGVTYVNVMHVAIKLAYFMGFTTILVIGMEHKPHNARTHFWGEDAGMQSPDANLVEIFDGYKQLRLNLEARGRTILNISEGTYVPEDILPRQDWRAWKNKE